MPRSERALLTLLKLVASRMPICKFRRFTEAPCGHRAVLRPVHALDVPEEPGNDGAGDLPGWCMPPQMIGGYVTGPVLIGRSDGLVAAARQVLTYPAGVEAEVEAHARRSPAGATPPPGPVDLTAHPQLRSGVRFADGRSAVQDDET